MDPTDFLRLSVIAADAANGDSNDAEIDALWDCVDEAARQMGVASPRD